MADATTYGNAMSVAEDASALDCIKASGRTTLYTPTTAEREEIKKAMMVVHRDMEIRLGRDNILAMYKASGFAPPKRIVRSVRRTRRDAPSRERAWV